MAKRIKNNRRINQRRNITWELRCKLAELSKGKTPPEVHAAHTEFYYTCNVPEQIILLKIFKEETDKETTEIAEFFAEKQND